MSTKADTRTMSLVDVLRARRLTETGTILDAQVRCTSAGAGLNSALLASIMPHTSRHTLVAQADEQLVMGQYDMTQGNKNAHLVYIAPQLKPADEDDAWLLLLDAMVKEAGKRGAHVLIGEVDEDSPLFVTMRQSGFAVYARQALWARQPHAAPEDNPQVRVRRATEDDSHAIYGLYRRTVPRLLQQIGAPPSLNGFVYQQDKHTLAFVHMTEGRDGILFTPYIDPDTLPIAGEIIQAAAQASLRSGERVVTVRIQRHQGWLGSMLEPAGFRRVAEQAVMVRHIAAGVHAMGFASLNEKRQTNEVPEACHHVGYHTPTHALAHDPIGDLKHRLLEHEALLE